MSYRVFLVVIALFALTCASQAQIKEASDIDVRLAKVALRFFVAQGNADACGDACRKWIAVEGEFDRGSAERLTTFIKQNNLAALPIFFNSTGGFTDEGIAVGRLLRELNMRAGVARAEPACRAAERKCGLSEPISALWRAEGAQCNSACVFALMGGGERWVPEKSRIGVHSTAVFCFSDKNGKRVSPFGNSKDAIDCRKKITAQLGLTNKFIREMGISGDLSELIQAVPNSRMRYLTRDELTQFRIQTGVFK